MALHAMRPVLRIVMVAEQEAEVMGAMVEMAALVHTFLVKLLTMALMVAVEVMAAMVEVATALNRPAVAVAVMVAMALGLVLAVMGLPTMAREEMANMVAKQVNPVSA